MQPVVIELCMYAHELEITSIYNLQFLTYAHEYAQNVGWARKKYRNKVEMKTQEDYLIQKIMVKKHQKTTLCLLPDYATDVE